MLRKPVTFERWHFAGSATEAGTDPRAAWCNTKSTPEHARSQAFTSAMSPSTKRNRSHWRGDTEASTSSRFLFLPVEKLSNPTTLCSSFSSASSRFVSMKPATPVTSHVLGEDRKSAWTLEMFTCDGCYEIHFAPRKLFRCK